MKPAHTNQTRSIEKENYRNIPLSLVAYTKSCWYWNSIELDTKRGRKNVLAFFLRPIMQSFVVFVVLLFHINSKITLCWAVVASIVIQIFFFLLPLFVLEFEILFGFRFSSCTPYGKQSDTALSSIPHSLAQLTVGARGGRATNYLCICILMPYTSSNTCTLYKTPSNKTDLIDP